MAGYGSIIKEELLGQQIKSPCCRSSFICGTEVFAKSRKNEFTEPLEAYKAKLRRIKERKKTFFDDEIAQGYTATLKDGQKIPSSSGRICPLCSAHLVRGAFLVCGRGSASKGEVHIEMALPNAPCVELFRQLLSDVDVPVKYTERRGERLIYIKKHEVAADFLAFIGASTLAFSMIQDLIFNQRRSQAIRQTNCDSKNIDKAIKAASEQVRAIDAIIKNGAFDALSAPLRETAMLRYKNPSESLDVLVSLHEGEISRSGVNHRLTRIIELAKRKGFIKD